MLNDSSGYWSADKTGLWATRHTQCPECGHFAIRLLAVNWTNHKEVRQDLQVWPKGTTRAPVPPEVPDTFVRDYKEACLVLADSPKSAAALARRCLQHLLRDHVKVKRSDLSREIDELLASKTLPSDLAQAVDAIRAVGNFAAHPEKSQNTGAIIDVEPGEAELLLDVLESLFDFYFVRPAQLIAKLDAINKKLKDAGKPPMK